jgi:hypothetical protein
MHQELEEQNKWISDNTLQILAVKVLTQTIENGISMLTNEIDKVNTSVVAITTSSKSVPSKWELLLHAHTMEEQMVQVPEMNTGLTTAMEGYKLSESSPYNLRRTSVTAGPLGTQYVHPQGQAAFDHQSVSISSLRDTEIECSWHARIRGGAGSNGAAGGADS